MLNDLSDGTLTNKNLIIQYNYGVCAMITNALRILVGCGHCDTIGHALNGHLPYLDQYNGV